MEYFIKGQSIMTFYVEGKQIDQFVCNKNDIEDIMETCIYILDSDENDEDELEMGNTTKEEDGSETNHYTFKGKHIDVNEKDFPIRILDVENCGILDLSEKISYSIYDK